MKIEELKIASPSSLSSFMPVSFWAQGPWAFFNMGLQFFQTWQNECFARLRLVPSAAKAVAPVASVAPAARQAPVPGCLQNVEVVGGPVAATPEVVKSTEPAAKKVAAVVAPVAKASVVVAKAAAKAPAKPKAAVAPAAKPVLQSPPLAEPVAKAVVAESAPVAEAPAADAAPMSVTSMLAMQAKSLAKAVTTGPRQPAVAKTAKAVSKPAAVAKAPVKTAAPAVNAKPAAAKAAASKKA